MSDSLSHSLSNSIWHCWNVILATNLDTLCMIISWVLQKTIGFMAHLKSTTYNRTYHIRKYHHFPFDFQMYLTTIPISDILFARYLKNEFMWGTSLVNSINTTWLFRRDCVTGYQIFESNKLHSNYCQIEECNFFLVFFEVWMWFLDSYNGVRLHCFAIFKQLGSK